MLTKEENELITGTRQGTPMGEFWRRFWIPFALATELPERDGAPIRVTLLSESLIAFRTTSGKVGLVGNHCPHRGASLFFGRNEEEGLRCVYHGWKFDVEGNCVDMPNEPPESNFKHKIHHAAYPCREAGGLLWTFMGPTNLEPEMPDLEWTLVPDDQVYSQKILAESNWLQALEGDIDHSHVPFAHGLITDEPDKPFMERVLAASARRREGGGGGQGNLGGFQVPTETAQEIHPRGYVHDTDFGITMGWRKKAGPDNWYWRINQWMVPSHVMLASQHGQTMTCNTRVPIDDHTSWMFRIRWNPWRTFTADEIASFGDGTSIFPALIPGTFRPVHNKDNDYGIDRALQKTTSVTGITTFTQQDRAVTESMGKIFDRTREHLGTSDIVVIAMRRRLLKFARDLEEGKEPFAAHNGEIFRQRGTELILRKEDEWVTNSMELTTVNA